MTAHRILFGLLTPGLGGHTRTAVAIAEVLRDRGHAIDFAVSASPGSARADGSAATTTLIRAAGFPVVLIAGVYALPFQQSFRRRLRDLVRQTPYDALHWFELHAGVRDAAIVAARERRAFVWTVTSGGVPSGYYGLPRVVVFTKEVAEDARRRSPRTVVHVLPARIDLRSLTPDVVEAARHEIRSRLAIDDRELLVVRVARCSSVYLRSVHWGLALAERLVREGRPARFLHAGYVEDPGVADEIRRLVDQANRSAGRTVAWSVTDDVEAGTRYLAAADVCIGSGRSAIESVALERPTLVAWGSRFPGIVDAENIEQMADTNFQGRNTERIVSDDEVVGRMRDAVSRRFDEPDRGAAIQMDAARFVRSQYSVESAAEVYEHLYFDRTMTVDGALEYYANLRHLGRELYHRLPLNVRAGRTVSALRRAKLWPGLQRLE